MNLNLNESNFTQQIVKTIISELKKYPDCQARRVRVKIGEMLQPNGEDVQNYYDHLTKGTCLEGVELDLEKTHIVIHCKNCRRESVAITSHFLLCPLCRSTNVTMMSGDEIAIESIDLEKIV